MTSFVLVCSVAIAATTGSPVATQKTVTARSVAACQEWASHNSGKVSHWVQFQLPLYQNRYEAICGPDGVDCIHLEPRA